MWQIVSDKSDELGQKCLVFLAFLLTTPNKFVKMFLTIFLLCHISLVHAVGNSYSLVGVIIFKINIFLNIQTFHMRITIIKLYIYIKPNVCVCLVFQLRHILLSVIKIIIYVAILIQCTKHTLKSLSLVKGDPQTRKMNSSMNTPPYLMREREREREKGKWNIMYEPISNENEEK